MLAVVNILLTNMKAWPRFTRLQNHRVVFITIKGDVLFTGLGEVALKREVNRSRKIAC